MEICLLKVTSWSHLSQRMSACEKQGVAFENKSPRGDPGKACCSRSRFHHPQRVVIIVPLCSDWTWTPVDLHLSEAPDKAELSRMGLLCSYGGKETSSTALFPPPFHLFFFHLTDFRRNSPRLILSPVSATTWPTRELVSSKVFCLGRKEVMRQVSFNYVNECIRSCWVGGWYHIS